MKSRNLPKILLSLLVILFFSVAVQSSPIYATPTTVTIPGSFQSELGCSGDWQPDCTNTYLTYDADDDVWQATFNIPADAYEYKAALNNSWDENYGLNAERDGPNILLPLASDTAVKFYYDDTSHWVTDNQNSVIATVPGNFQSELGCASDWDPGCLRSWLQDPDGDGLYSFTTDALTAGAYEAKVAINESWDENYGAGGVQGGDNIPFTVSNDGDVVTFAYDPVNHILNIRVTEIVPVDDAALVRPVLQHPFQDDVLYFAIPDRFNDGNAANNCGDYAGECVIEDPDTPNRDAVLTHGYLPSNKGYYHGGDIEGLRKQLPYLQRMGVTAIWVGPIYKNKTVQPDSTSLFGYSAGYHGYWILDFKQVDPHLGTNDEFRRLVDEAHDRGIQVFMDIVTNHTADVIQLEGNAGYRNKTDFPYLDANGAPFNDSEFAYFGQGDYTFPAVNANTFPYTPVIPAGEENAKNPAWLNDPFLYHNRGDSSFVGENSLYGDFFGLDDLWTERKEVVEGMIDIYKFWIEEFGVDGFRIDTTKHVNLEFWQKFGPDILAAAEAEGIDHFFAFGEVFDQQFGPPFMSLFSTKGQLQSTIDFAFQLAARDFASQSGNTDNLRDFFEKDDYYTDTDSNAYAMPTFVGNHDMGRIGYFLQRVDQTGANDAELLARSQLVHALMFFARGQPVIYYGDEQGFTGDGGDKDAREDMFANSVDVYEDNDLIGTDATTSDDNFDTFHPIYQALREYAKLYQQHEALRRGAQIHRYSSDSSGIYAFSRIEREEKIEYIVAFNNSEVERTAAIPTYYPPGSMFKILSNKLFRDKGQPEMVSTDDQGQLTLTVPGLDFVIYRAIQPIPVSTDAPEINISSLQHGQTVRLGVNSWDGHDVLDRIEVRADLDRELLAEVTFAVRVNGGDYVPIGTDDNPPYRVFYDVSDLPEDSNLSFRAIVNDLSGHLNAAEVVNIGFIIERPTGPGLPYAVIHYNRPGDDYGDHTTGDFNDFWGLHLWGNGIDIAEVTNWPTPKPFLGEDEYGRFAWVKLTDETQPLNFIVHQGDTKDPDNSPDRSFVPGDTPEIWLKQGDVNIYTSQAEAQGFTTVHYQCSDCSGVTLDVSGGNVIQSGTDDYGAFFQVAPSDFSTSVFVTISDGGAVDIDGQSFIPAENASVWFQQGDQTVYPSRGAAEDFATIHYYRPDGDFGDPSSVDFNDFWGLHVWTGTANPTAWPDPIRPSGNDVFGAVFTIDLVDAADQLAYIIHRGDTKDPGPDQFLIFDKYGHEVWQVQGADPATPYVAPAMVSTGIASDSP